MSLYRRKSGTWRWVAAAIAALTFVLPATLDAQAWKGKGRLEGTVVDQQGKPIVDATVKLRLGTSGPDVKTDKKGRWVLMGLTGGEWTIEIEAPGFIPGKVIVTVSEIVRQPPIDYKMEPVPVAEPEKPESTGLPPEIVEAVKNGNDALDQKRWADARAAFEKAATALPDNMSLLFALSRAYHGEGNVPKAVETLEKVVEKEPTNNGARLLIANMLLEKGDLEKGRAALEKVPSEFIKDPTIYINIGVLFLNKTKQVDAESYFTKAVGLAPAEADGYYYRGLARVAQNKYEEARGDFTRYLELNPNGNEAEEVKQLLKSLTPQPTPARPPAKKK